MAFCGSRMVFPIIPSRYFAVESSQISVVFNFYRLNSVLLAALQTQGRMAERKSRIWRSEFNKWLFFSFILTSYEFFWDSSDCTQFFHFITRCFSRSRPFTSFYDPYHLSSQMSKIATVSEAARLMRHNEIRPLLITQTSFHFMSLKRSTFTTWTNLQVVVFIHKM